MTTLGALLSTAAGDPTRPVLTYYDDLLGERAELSGATLGNWVAKTANLLVDGVGTQPGDVALVQLPPHWQTAAVLLGCWSAGLIVTNVALPSGVVVAFAGPVPDTAETPSSPDAAGVSPIVAGERYVLGLRPLGVPLPIDQVPAGSVDFNGEVRAYGDRFVPAMPVSDDMPAIAGNTHAELVELAEARAAHLGIKTGDRVLVDAAAHPDQLDWLLAPLAAGASIVLCGQLDRDPDRLANRVAAERVTVTLA